MTYFFDIKEIPNQPSGIYELRLVVKTHDEQGEITMDPGEASVNTWTSYIDGLIEELEEIKKEGTKRLKKHQRST